MAAIASREQRPVTARTARLTSGRRGRRCGRGLQRHRRRSSVLRRQRGAPRRQSWGQRRAEASAAWTGGERESTDDGDGSARDRGSVGGEGEQEQAHSGCEAAQLSVL